MKYQIVMWGHQLFISHFMISMISFLCLGGERLWTSQLRQTQTFDEEVQKGCFSLPSRHHSSGQYTLSTGHRGAVGGMHWTQFWWGVLVVVVKTHPFLREIKGWNRTHVWGNDLWIRLPYWVPPLTFPPEENNLNIWCTLTPPATVERQSEVNNQKKMPLVWQAITLRN